LAWAVSITLEDGLASPPVIGGRWFDKRAYNGWAVIGVAHSHIANAIGVSSAVQQAAKLAYSSVIP